MWQILEFWRFRGQPGASWGAAASAAGAPPPPPRPPAGRGDEVLLVSILAAKWVGRERSRRRWRRMWITSWGPGGAEPRQRQGGSRCQARGQGRARPRPPRPVVLPACCRAGPGARPPRPRLSSRPGLGKGCAAGGTVAGPGPPGEARSQPWAAAPCPAPLPRGCPGYLSSIPGLGRGPGGSRPGPDGGCTEAQWARAK